MRDNFNTNINIVKGGKITLHIWYYTANTKTT